VIRRITALAFVLSLVSLSGALADDVGGGEVIMIEKQTATPMPPMEEPVTAAPPPFVELETTAIAAGIGARFGGGTLLVEGQEHPFTMRGVSLGDVGVSRISASGLVQNLQNVSDFEGNYVAVEAGASAGVGASKLTMRNEKGVVITLDSDVKGAQLTLGAQGLSVELD
jgi:hypothetical protein